MKTYKLKSLMYLTAFVLTALAYHFIQENEKAEAAQHSVVATENLQSTPTETSIF